VHPGTDNLTIPRYVSGLADAALPPGTTQPQVAARIDARADAALTALAGFHKTSAAKAQPELAATLEDIRAMALLGKYYAAKIRGATALAYFRQTRAPAHQTDAVQQLRLAQQHWAEYTQRTAERYRSPLWTNRVGHVDWQELAAEVAHDITIAAAPLSEQ
jgi:hypothetical protein